MSSSVVSLDDELVLGNAARLVEVARERMPWYAGDFAPIRTDQEAELLRRSTCLPIYMPFRSRATAFVAPPVKGVYPIAINRGASRTDRQFSIRHELAHVLNGDVEEATYLSDTGYMSHAERVCDLFALADLVPGWMLAQLRRARVSWPRVASEVRGAILCTYAEGWPADRVEDRAKLRLRLYRECGI